MGENEEIECETIPLRPSFLDEHWSLFFSLLSVFFFLKCSHSIVEMIKRERRRKKMRDLPYRNERNTMRFDRERITHERKTQARWEENSSREAYWTENVRKSTSSKRTREHTKTHAHMNLLVELVSRRKRKERRTERNVIESYCSVWQHKKRRRII